MNIHEYFEFGAPFTEHCILTKYRLLKNWIYVDGVGEGVFFKLYQVTPSKCYILYAF